MTSEKPRRGKRRGNHGNSPKRGPRIGRVPATPLPDVQPEAAPLGTSDAGQGLTTPGDRGPDLVPRGSIKLLYQTLLTADGDLAQQLRRDKSPRARLLAGLIRACGRSPLAVAERVGNRLEGLPVRTVHVQKRRVTVFKNETAPPQPGDEVPVEPDAVDLAAPVRAAVHDPEAAQLVSLGTR